MEDFLLPDQAQTRWYPAAFWNPAKRHMKTKILISNKMFLRKIKIGSLVHLNGRKKRIKYKLAKRKKRITVVI